MTWQEIDQIITRAEVGYGLFLIVFLLMYIAFYRNQKNQPSIKK